MKSDETSQEIDMVIGSNEDEETSEDVADTPFTPRCPPGKQSLVNIVRQVPGPCAAARQNLAKEVNFWEGDITVYCGIHECCNRACHDQAKRHSNRQAYIPPRD